MKIQKITIHNFRSIIHQVIDCKNEFVKTKISKLHGFEKDFEAFLGIKSDNNRKDLKPLNVLKNYEDGNITGEKIEELKEIIKNVTI